MDISIFTDKSRIPNDDDLSVSLGNTFRYWQMLKDHVHLKFPKAMDEWKYPGDKYGWSFRVKDKKRVIIYLLPRENYFKAAMVFGQKATDIIMKTGISPTIKTALESARVYAEGRGIRIAINDEVLIDDIKALIDIKLGN